MSDIRPMTWRPVAPQPAAPGRTDAQKAFFDAAMGRAAAPVAEASPQRPAVSRTLQPAPTDEPPKKILRPGSLVDIKV